MRRTLSALILAGVVWVGGAGRTQAQYSLSIGNPTTGVRTTVGTPFYGGYYGYRPYYAYGTTGFGSYYGQNLTGVYNPGYFSGDLPIDRYGSNIQYGNPMKGYSSYYAPYAVGYSPVGGYTYGYPYISGYGGYPR